MNDASALRNALAAVLLMSARIAAAQSPAAPVELSAATAQPQAVLAEMTQPEVTQPQVSQPRALQPQVLNPDALEPQALQSHALQQQVEQPQTVQPQAAQARSLEPQGFVASAETRTTPFGDAFAVPASTLHRIAGREDLSQAVIASNTSTVANNSVGDQSTTGVITFDGQSFEGLRGLAVINANTGNNVAINASLNVNVAIHP